ncbi:hypothetical protein DERF_010738 [Dermatophagoides farinae]|uniref:Uncharacterized protein n=1 Tax=Dermatophagoides farinae TaxID=6954 RepID=A0A922L2F3_DERFA|nr:hypothetical protein DERF_010738 [Dermatophagoides farinae]
MDIVQVYYTDMESNPPLYDVYWKDCEFSLLNPFQSGEQNSHNGSDYYFVIKILKIIPTAQEQEPNRQYEKGAMKMIQLSTIRELWSLESCELTFNIDQRPIHYRVEFSNDFEIIWMISLIISEIPCFVWNEQITNLSERHYVVQNEILCKKHYKPIESPQNQITNNNDDDDDETIEKIRSYSEPGNYRRKQSRSLTDIQQIIESWADAITDTDTDDDDDYDYDATKEAKNVDTNNENLNIGNDVDYYWTENDMKDMTFNVDEFDDDEFFNANDDSSSSSSSYYDDYEEKRESIIVENDDKNDLDLNDDESEMPAPESNESDEIPTMNETDDDNKTVATTTTVNGDYDEDDDNDDVDVKDEHKSRFSILFDFIKFCSFGCIPKNNLDYEMK